MWNDPVLLALALTDHHGAAFGIEIPQLDVSQFGPPHARGVERLENRAVAQAQRLVDLRLSEDLFGFRGGQHGLRQSKTETRHFQLGCGIVQDVMLAGHPLEPHAQGNEPVLLAREGQRLAVLLAIVEDMTLIRFQNGARYFQRLGDTAWMRTCVAFQPVYSRT